MTNLRRWPSYRGDHHGRFHCILAYLYTSMGFLSPGLDLYLYKSALRPCMEHCCHILAGAPCCYLELLDKLQKRISKTVGSSLATSREPLAHHQNVASLSLFCRYYVGRC